MLIIRGKFISKHNLELECRIREKHLFYETQSKNPKETIRKRFQLLLMHTELF